MCVYSESLCGWFSVLVYISMVYVHPLLTSGPSQTGSGADSGGNDVILSQNVYGELAILKSLVREWVLRAVLPFRSPSPANAL